MKRAVLPLALSTLTLLAVAVNQTAVQRFDVKDPKGVNGLSITIDSPLEPQFGTAADLSGFVDFNESNPTDSSAHFIVGTNSVRLATPGITEAMLQEWCLNPAKYPTIEFKTTKINAAEKLSDNVWKINASGDFTLSGVTKPLEIVATITKVPGGLQQRGGVPRAQGDLLVVRSDFSINRRDFNVAPDLSDRIIGNKIDLKLAAVTTSITSRN